MAGQFLILIFGENSMEAVVCDNARQQKTLFAACTVSFAELDTDETADSVFKQALDTAASQLDLSSCSSASVLVHCSHCFFRTSRLPFKSENKIRQVLPLELASTFPSEEDRHITDFLVSGPVAGKELFSVFSASIETSKAEEFAAGLKAYGIKPGMVSVLGPGLAAAFLKSGKSPDNFIFLTPEEDKISAVLVADRKIFQVRTFNARTDPHFSLDMELNRMILGFRQKHKSQKPFDLIHVTRDQMQHDDRLHQCLETTLAFQTDLEQSGGLSPDSKPAETQIGTIAFQSLVALMSPDRDFKGLINFYRGRSGAGSFFKTHAKNCIATGLLALTIFFFLMAALYSQINDLEKKIAYKKQVAAEIFTRTFPGRSIGNLDPLLAMKAAIKSEGSEKNAAGKETMLDLNGLKAVETLYELSVRVPAAIDMEISRLIQDRERLIISGSTLNFNSVDQIKGLIEKSDLFKTVEISSAAAKKDGKRVEFKFIIGM